MSDMVQIPREVLEKIQWGSYTDLGVKSCVVCGSTCFEPHKEDCPIGIALKPKDVIKEVKVIPQHEMDYYGQKLVTKIGGGVNCRGCYLRTDAGECKAFAANDGDIDSRCCGGSNRDMKNRIWVKAE
jgi:hypothetical protein